MIKGKNSIRFLRHLGMIMIVLPEPITTVFGLVLVFALRYLSRRLEARVYKRLREAIKQYIVHFKWSYYKTDAKLSEPAKESGYISDKDLIHHQYEGNCAYKASPSRLGENNWHDACQGTASHTQKMQMLSRLYKGGDSGDSSGVGHRPSRTPDTEKVTHYCLNMELLSQRYKIASVEPVKLIHHAIDMVSLQRRYGPAAASSKPGDPMAKGSGNINDEYLIPRQYDGTHRLE